MSLRQALKRIAFGTALVLVSPLIAAAWLEDRLVRGEAVFSGLAQLLALVPGPPGTLLRGAYYFGTLQGCSWETHVGFGSLFTHRGGALGVRASMGSYCVIGHARLGDGVMIGSRVSIPSGKRQHFDATGQLSDEGVNYDTVTIGPRTWIGEGAIVMADIGEACVVSAGAVVIKAMPDRAVIGGNPARVLRELS